MIISFAWTTKALLDGSKTVTRRTWKARYHSMWLRAWSAGNRVHKAYDKDPRAGGKHVADIELTCAPYYERLRDMPEEDLALEGCPWCGSVEEFAEGFGGPDVTVSVIRFKLLRRVSDDQGVLL